MLSSDWTKVVTTHAARARYYSILQVANLELGCEAVREKVHRRAQSESQWHISEVAESARDRDHRDKLLPRL